MMDKQHLNFASAYYYLQFDGSGHQPLFAEQAECELFKELLSQLQINFSASIYAYCLLPDSVHLIIKTGIDGCDVICDWLLECYTDTFNQRHNRHGSVIQPHYIATLLEPSVYLLPVVRQLHNLPVTHRLVPHSAVYRWSSHRDYLSSSRPAWLMCDEVLQRLTPHSGSRRRRYEDYVELDTQTSLDWISGNHNEFYALATQTYLQQWLSKPKNNEEIRPINLTELAHWVCQETGLVITDLQLRRRHRLGNEVRATIAALAEMENIASVIATADFLEMDREILINGVRALKAQRALYLLNMHETLLIFMQSRKQNEAYSAADDKPYSDTNRSDDDSDKDCFDDTSSEDRPVNLTLASELKEKDSVENNSLDDFSSRNSELHPQKLHASGGVN